MMRAILLVFYQSLGLALALFVPGVGANDTDDAFATDDFAIFAKLFN